LGCESPQQIGALKAQPERNKGIPLKEEYLKFLRKYSIDFNEQYLWE
jgi:hypothetical protein